MDGDKICCCAMPVIVKEKGESKKLCTYFSKPEENKYEYCIDVYCEECDGYMSRKEWYEKRLKEKENNERYKV